MDSRLSEALAHLPDYFGNHVLVSMTALALGLIVSLPLAFTCLRPPHLARDPADADQHCTNSAGPGAARSVLSVAARCGVALVTLVRRELLGARLPPRRAGAGALQHAPDPAQHNHRADRNRRGRHRSRARCRHDLPTILAHGGGAARAAGNHGRHPYVGSMGHRNGDALDADWPDQPGQLHLHRPADAELDFRVVRLLRRGPAGARDRSVAGSDRKRCRRSPAATRGGRNGRIGSHCRTRVRLNTVARCTNLSGRRQAVFRAIHSSGLDRAKA